MWQADGQQSIPISTSIHASLIIMSLIGEQNGAQAHDCQAKRFVT